MTNVVHVATFEQLSALFILFFFRTLCPLLKWASVLRHRASWLTGKRKILNSVGPGLMAVKGVKVNFPSLQFSLQALIVFRPSISVVGRRKRFLFANPLFETYAAITISDNIFKIGQTRGLIKSVYQVEQSVLVFCRKKPPHMHEEANKQAQPAGCNSGTLVQQQEFLLDCVRLPQRMAHLSIWIKQTNAVWYAVAWKWTVRSINYLIAITNK